MSSNSHQENPTIANHGEDDDDEFDDDEDDEDEEFEEEEDYDDDEDDEEDEEEDEYEEYESEMNEIDEIERRLIEFLKSECLDAKLNELPTIRFVNDEELDESEKECSICIEEYKVNDRLKVIACAHKFHSDCIRAWLKKNETCPLCLSSAF